MSTPYRLPRASRVAWIAALILIPLLSVGATFAFTDDTLVDHQNSKVAQQYTQIPVQETGEEEPLRFPTRYGQPGGSNALVLYDDRANPPQSAEMYAIVVANLATHFGEVQILTTDDYTRGLMESFDAAIYVGVDHLSKLPQELLDDVRQASVPVLWLGQNADDLVEGAAPGGRDFVAQYGWDPHDPVRVPNEEVQRIRYKDRLLTRVVTSSPEVYMPRILDAQQVEVLSTGVCGKPDGRPRACDVESAGRAGEVPWVIRSGNLTFVADLPLNYIDHSQDYLMFADLYYDLLGPDIEPVRQAAVRLEDVGPQANPEQLRRVADYLHSQKVPFQVAVVPVTIDRTPSHNAWIGLTLLDSPEVVEALQYMQQRGGTLIQHGTTHQYGATDNPYSGRSGEDYEFFMYGCSRTEFPPYAWEPCVTDSWVRKSGPVAQDKVSDHRERLEQGRQIMIEAGLGEPTIFETPHYTASVTAYSAMAQMYDARYEQVEYYAGMISSGEIDPHKSYGQIFPYSVHDIYGSRVYPENLQNVTEAEQNNHAIRTPQTLIDRAEANLVVRESTASFYFHPFLDIAYLEELVTGMHGLGYEFVPVTDLK